MPQWPQWQYQAVLHVNGVPEEMKRGDRKNMWRNNGWKIFRFGANFKPTDPRSSVNSKQKKHKGNHLKAHHHKFYEKQW